MSNVIPFTSRAQRAEAKKSRGELNPWPIALALACVLWGLIAYAAWVVEMLFS